MAETSPLKRQREATPDEEEEEKRQKSYKDILSLLEEEEDLPGQDLSSLITSLQQELASVSSDPLAASAEEAGPEATSSSASPAGEGGGEGGDERERVMRRLLEASDDELGLPYPPADLLVPLARSKVKSVIWWKNISCPYQVIREMLSSSLMVELRLRVQVPPFTPGFDT
ncbi:uncharacterized protein LOC104455750 [Eucalyptus grandis]|uniref:uncharacterized protein LOC104455750 n=1 Tax=Eucalyptus grandis TaxID=71139 RepID=UPI00192E90FE|nr:uncharacterized protein LOC104455750 [Eucalyptus grandis]